MTRKRRRKIMKSEYRHLTLAVLSVILCLSNVSAEDLILVHEAWMLEAPTNARVIAGYMTIENKSSRSRRLIGVSGQDFERIEIHQTEMQGDIMRMVPMEELEIPAGSAVSLEPGSYHLMLISPRSVPKEGEAVNLELQFDSGYTMHIKLIVRAVHRGKTMKHFH
ncbi:MAG: copper chaperone PCu(A)C [Nitrospiraceae bacterium]|nr:MAG: copper chaperone PCu(A)C [Nitrospiraceae bacterium]